MDWELSFLMWIQEHIVNGFLTPIMKAFTTLGNGGTVSYTHLNEMATFGEAAINNEDFVDIRE